MILLTSEEIEQVAAYFGVATEGQSLADIQRKVRQQLPDIFRREREKLPHKGFAHNGGNLDKFVEYLQSRKDLKVVSTMTFDRPRTIKVRFEDFSSLEVYEEQIRMDFCWDELGMGLHSDSYDVIIQFLFDPNGAIQLAYQKYKSLEETLDYYCKIYNDIINETEVKKALANEKQLEILYASYLEMCERLRPIRKYLDFEILDWNACLKAHGIVPSLNMIAEVKRLMEGKSSEKCNRFAKRYTEAQQVLIGAQTHGLLNSAEQKEIIPWEDLLSELTNSDILDKKRAAYLSVVSQFYIHAIERCDYSGTRYMQKKKSKILADMEVCKIVKELCGADCFIDRSMHKNTVYHVNFVLNDNQVLVFRIGNETPSVETCMRFAKMSIALDSISKQLSKTIHLQYFKAGITGVDANYSEDIQAKLSYLLTEGGAIELSKSYMSIYLPTEHSVGFKITLKIKESDCRLNQILPMINDYLAAYSEGDAINMKGVFTERKPNL